MNLFKSNSNTEIPTGKTNQETFIQDEFVLKIFVHSIEMKFLFNRLKKMIQLCKSQIRFFWSNLAMQSFLMVKFSKEVTNKNKWSFVRTGHKIIYDINECDPKGKPLAQFHFFFSRSFINLIHKCF